MEMAERFIVTPSSFVTDVFFFAELGKSLGAETAEVWFATQMNARSQGSTISPNTPHCKSPHSSSLPGSPKLPRLVQPPSRPADVFKLGAPASCRKDGKEMKAHTQIAGRHFSCSYPSKHDTLQAKTRWREWKTCLDGKTTNRDFGWGELSEESLLEPEAAKPSCTDKGQGPDAYESSVANTAAPTRPERSRCCTDANSSPVTAAAHSSVAHSKASEERQTAAKPVTAAAHSSMAHSKALEERQTAATIKETADVADMHRRMLAQEKEGECLGRSGMGNMCLLYTDNAHLVLDKPDNMYNI